MAVVLAQSPPPCPGICTPGIDKSTEVVPVPVLKATCEIIPDYGSCSPIYRDYAWFIQWGDGVTDTGSPLALMPVQVVHPYTKSGTYNVSISYCAKPLPPSCCQNCATTTIPVTVA